jgi:hypothetical protein
LTVVTVLTVLLLVAATSACVALIWVSRETVVAVRSARIFIHDVRVRLLPVLEKADVTVDAANAELLRVDAAITRFEDASIKVSAASGTISEIVSAPGEIVSGVAERVRRKWKGRHHAPEEEPTGECETLDETVVETSE